MGDKIFAVVVLCAVVASGVPALLYARRVNVLSAAEFLLPVMPVLLLFVSMQTFNAPAQTGYAFIIYPPLAIVASVALLYVRVFLLRHVRVPALSMSIVVLAISCVTAFIVGAIAPPWYE